MAHYSGAHGDEEGELPSVLLLGGLGMVGINFLKYLVDFRLASFIRVVDKRVPAICDLAPMFLEALASPEVEFMQADVSIPRHVERAFAKPTNAPPPRSSANATSTTGAGKHTAPRHHHHRHSRDDNAAATDSFTIIVNAAAESSYGYLDAVYEQNIVEVRQRCAAAAAALCNSGRDSGGCECYIEVSSSEVYDCGDNPKKPATEADGVIAPWTTLGRYHAAAERWLQESPDCAGLPWIIVRLPIVYGPADKRGLMPRLACASTYARTGEKMELLWGSSLRIHTVHVQDAVSAMWHLACTGRAHEVYNICDDGDTSQGTLNKLIGEIFGIQTGFYSNVLTRIAGSRLQQLAEEANAGHMEVWNEMLREAGIAITCITPYIEPELLANRHLCISNAKLKALGFQPSCPRVTKELLLDVMEYWTAMRLFPPKKVVFRRAS